MDPSHNHAHIIGDIAKVKNQTHTAIEVDLHDSLDVSSLPIVAPVHSQPEDTTPALPFFMQIFLGTSSFAFVAALLLARVFSPAVVPEAEAGRMRQLPQTACHGSLCITPMSSASSVRSRALRQTAASSSSEAASIVRESSSSASSEISSDSPFNPFRRFHAAPPDQPEIKKPKRADNVQGVYLTAPSVKRTEFLDETIAKVKAAGGDSITFDIKGGFVFFDHADMPKAKELGLIRPLYDLPAIIEKLDAEGIYSIGRFVAVKDHELTARMPETRQKHPVSGVTLVEDWIDPSNEKALEINREYMCAAAMSGIDEINLDYIRMTTAAVGALRVFDGQQKADKVEKFVKMAREAIDECGDGTTSLGLSTYAILGWNYEVNLATLGQDVVRFVKSGDVDVISPMAYPATFTSEGYYVPGKHPGPRDYWLVFRTLTGYTDLLKEHVDAGTVVIRPWIQGYYIDGEDARQQIRAVYDAGYCGYQFWNANNNYGYAYTGMKNAPPKPEKCL